MDDRSISCSIAGRSVCSHEVADQAGARLTLNVFGLPQGERIVNGAADYIRIYYCRALSPASGAPFIPIPTAPQKQCPLDVSPCSFPALSLIAAL